MGNDPHEGDVLQSLMGSAVRADGNAGMGAAELDVEFIITDRIAYLSPRPACQKDAVCRNEGDEARQRQAGCRTVEVLFRYADIDIFFSIFLADPFGPRRFGDVRIEDEDIVVKASQFQQGLPIAVAHRYSFHYGTSVVSSSMARRYWASSGAAPCHFA